MTIVQGSRVRHVGWVDWLSHQRLLEPIGNIPPAEAEENYYAMLNRTAMAACVKPKGLRRTRGGSKCQCALLAIGQSPIPGTGWRDEQVKAATV
jgi:hypothetical protein